MTELKITPVSFAMQAGLYLGLLGIAKFLLLSLSLDYAYLGLFYMMVALLFHFAVYFYARKFKYSVMNGAISFFQVWNVSILMYFFASLVSGAAEFIYDSYINKTFVLTVYPKLAEAMQETYKQMQSPSVKEFLRQTIELLQGTPTPTPIQWVFGQIQNTISYGIVAALIFAMILSRGKVKADSVTPPKNEPMQ